MIDTMNRLWMGDSSPSCTFPNDFMGLGMFRFSQCINGLIFEIRLI